MVGIPAMQFLTGSAFEVIVYQAVTETIFKLMDDRDENLATRIANQVSKLFPSS